MNWWAAGCGHPQDGFVGGRSLDPCNADYPACNDVVGCILDGNSYTSGTFPGSGKFLVQTAGPSTVEVHFYLQNPTAGGTTTTLTWFESGCTSSRRTMVPGSVLLGEAQSGGEFVRSQDLSSAGDHLLTYSSDATSQYLVKVVIVPKM